jgi:hypothetical protein
MGVAAICENCGRDILDGEPTHRSKGGHVFCEKCLSRLFPSGLPREAVQIPAAQSAIEVENGALRVHTKWYPLSSIASVEVGQLPEDDDNAWPLVGILLWIGACIALFVGVETGTAIGVIVGLVTTIFMAAIGYLLIFRTGRSSPAPQLIIRSVAGELHYVQFAAAQNAHDYCRWLIATIEQSRTPSPDISVDARSVHLHRNQLGPR